MNDLKEMILEKQAKRKRLHNKVLIFCIIPIFTIFVLIAIFAPKDKEIPEDLKAKAEKQFQYRLKGLFDPYDGECFYVKRYIKENMNDASSYEHVKTLHKLQKDSTILIQTTYRGTNAFGAKVIQTNLFKIDLNGNILSVE